MPLLNIVDVLVAIVFGIVVFGELPAHGLPARAVQAAAIVLMAMGLLRPARTDAIDDAERRGTPSPAGTRS